jgi:hypothetical protein
MGRSFSIIFGFGEPFVGFAKLLLEVPNPPMEQTKVALGREVQRARNALHAALERSLDPAPKAKASHHQLLSLGILQELCDPRVLQKPRQAVFEVGHGCGPG